MSGQQKSVTVRLAVESDIPAVSELGTRVFTASFGYSVQPHQLKAFLADSYSIEATAAVIADPDRDLFVAVSPENDRTVLGFALMTRNSTDPCLADYSDTVELQRIYVDTASHGKGVGGALAKHVDSAARQQGFRYIWLGCWKENHKGLKFYQSLGYKAVGEHVFDIGGDIQYDDVMIKEL